MSEEEAMPEQKQSMLRDAEEFVKKYNTEIAFVCCFLMYRKNRKLVRENKKLLAKLAEAAKFTQQAANELEALSIFNEFFGPRAFPVPTSKN
jgi:hypothetical protein